MPDIFEELMLATEQYGPLLVMFVIIIMLLLLSFSHVYKTNKEMQKTQKEIIDKLLNDNENIKKDSNIIPTKTPAYNERDIVEIFVRLNETLKDECREVCEKTFSDRTAIYVFHNGTQASHGFPFFKMTCISEWISKGSTDNISLPVHANMPLSLFDTIVSDLYSNGNHVIEKNETGDVSDQMFIKGTKMVSCFLSTINDTDNKVMGFVVNGYNKETNFSDADKEYIKTELNNLEAKVRPVLEFSDYQHIGIRDERSND